MHISIEVPENIAQFILTLESDITALLNSDGEKYLNGKLQSIIKQKDVISLDLTEHINEVPLGLSSEELEHNLVLVRRNRLGQAIERFAPVLKSSRRLRLNEMDAICYNKLIQHYIQYTQDGFYIS